MKIAVFKSPTGETSYGLVENDGIIDIPRAGGPKSLVEALRTGRLTGLAPWAAGRAPDYRAGEVLWEPPLAGAGKILCVGVNYANRNEEYRDGTALPDYPSLFVRFPGSLVGHEQPLIRPKVSEQLDYEGEIVLVIGREGRHMPRERALDMIAGLTLANEGTIRDWLRHGKFNVTQGKNFDRTGSIGPWIVPASEVDLTQPLQLTTKVNGEVRQSDSTANMIFDFSRLIAYVTTFTTLMPGDLILTGTPTGAGARFDPPRWLRPGDIVEVNVPEIGTLRNGVADEV